MIKNNSSWDVFTRTSPQRMWRLWGLPASSRPWSTCTRTRRAATSLPRATLRSTSLGWSRREWPGWRCSWWSRWPTWSSGDHSSSSPWSTGAGSGRTPRSRCLTRWRQSRTCNPPSSWSQGLSSCGLCPLLCQPTSLCCPPQGLQVGEVYDKVSETFQSWHSPATHQARHPRSPLLQLLTILGEGGGGNFKHGGGEVVCTQCQKITR